ncbi:alpha-amylase family glycosyl hydrolase [Paraflavisolibacter sp. H34]|uniref:alpha-amylase family glycosyl hydrolase n=1 Tax=Huijunlia imazamoxiresistens TaxID=3127457 RepID=UPI00301B5EC4
MAMQTVEFHFITGLRRPLFQNARLRGSWDNEGRFSNDWTEHPMQETTGEDGCPVFTASVSLDLADEGKFFKWGVVIDGPQFTNFWGIPTELQDTRNTDRYRQFQLIADGPAPRVERYFLTYCRRLGANKRYRPDSPVPSLHFAVWAPNAQQVDVVFGERNNGYISDTGEGIDPTMPVIPLSLRLDGIWEGDAPGTFATYMSLPYMYRILTAQGQTVYRTDIFSRHQIGEGCINPNDPNTGTWTGTVETLDGTVSCSVVTDPDVVRRKFASTRPGLTPDLIPAEEFWATEFTAGLPVPTRIEDLVIYELHVGSLGFGKETAGDLGDAIAFLDHLVELGVNAVELLPMAEFSGNVSWGYGDSHHFCVEGSAGGRDKYRHFVRECHRRGIAVIQDVVYNHYDPNAARAQWKYDSDNDEQNIYYWFEGHPSDYRFPDGRPFPTGGYIDNGSTGYTPRFWEEAVRQQFISSAAFLLEEMHVDGLRVDLTQAIHRDNVLHADGRPVGSANIFGQKFLREWSRTLNMIHPTVMLFAEDHTGWEGVTRPPAQGGLGFDYTWDAEFYHNLVGDADAAGGKARLLKQAGTGGNEPLPMDRFSGSLFASQFNRVVFHESHDEAGNAQGSVRTLVVAANYAPLVGATRIAAENRARLAAGLSLLSAGTPMFFMGEEVGAQKPYTFDKFIYNREDILVEKQESGKTLFRFYQDIISLSRRLPSIRTQNIDILHVSNTNRVLVFKRWKGAEEVIIAASFNNTPFANGYVVQKDFLGIPNAGWKEVFNSDAALYGGRNIGNGGGTLFSSQARLNVVIPANGFVVLVKQ